MTFAIDRVVQQKTLSFDDFIAQYGSDNRYELIDGEVFDLEPTGPHEEVLAFITTISLQQRVVFKLTKRDYLGLFFRGLYYVTKFI